MTNLCPRKLKRRLRPNRCCLGFELADGVIGIVVWDSLYALFKLTTSLSAVFHFLELGDVSRSFTDAATAAFLIARASVGIWAGKGDFHPERIRRYLIIRVVWDILLLAGNTVMVSINEMPPQTYFLNALILCVVDGYLNSIIYHYRKKVLIIRKRSLRKRNNMDEIQGSYIKSDDFEKNQMPFE